MNATVRRDHIRELLADLKLPGALEAVDEILADVDRGILERQRRHRAASRRPGLLRNNRRLQTAMRSSRLPAIKTLKQFDCAFQPSLRREQLESLHELGFIKRKENVIFLGPPAWARHTWPSAWPSRRPSPAAASNYGTLVQLIESLEQARAAGQLARRLRVLSHPALLVVDEIGYLPVSRDGAVLFFQLINARYEHASTVLTSNKGFREWGEILGDEVMAAALIDRLMHHCHVVNIRGNSYRMREHNRSMADPAARARSLHHHPRRKAKESRTPHGS